ncbi:MAG: DMT family transporter [Burkholderiaceae bacterium]
MLPQPLIRSDYVRGLLLVAGATFFWSLSGVFTRFVPQVDPWTLNATRGLSMGIALLVWMCAVYRFETVTLFTASDPRALLIAGTFFAAGSSLYILALQWSSVAAASCIGTTSGMFAGLMARVWLRERTPPVFYVGLVIAIVGVVLIATGEAGSSTPGSLAGVAVSLAYALCFAGQSVALRRYSALRMEPAMVLAGFGIYFVVRFTVGLHPLQWGPMLLLLTMGVVQLAVPMVLYMRGARHVPAVQMVLITMADAVLTPLWVWLVHGEVPGVSVFWGGAVIMLAIAVTTWPSLKAARAQV